jgi:hypothetical protein
MHRKFRGWALGILLSSVLGSSGCTLAGAGLGALVDSGTQKKVPPERVAVLRSGKRVTVFLKNGGQLKGRYQRIEFVPESEYAEAYGRFRAQQPDMQRLPEMGESVEVSMKLATHWSGNWSGRFLGLDRGHLLVRSEVGAQPTFVALGKIQRISAAGRGAIEASALSQIASRPDMPPLASAILLEVGKNTVSVPIDTIDRVRIRSNATAICAGLGLVGDLTLLALLQSFPSD